MKKRFFAALLFGLAFVLCIVCFSSSAEVANAITYGSGYSAVLYNNTNGLPTSAVNAMVQTEEGFIWVGSYSGLIRYDGNTFYRYDSSTGVSSVVSLKVDTKNRLWIGTNDNGVFVLKDEVFRSYEKKDGLRSLSVRAVEEDNDGNMLIATTMGMAYVDTNDVMHTIDDSQINQEYVCELSKDVRGVIYGVTMKGAIFTIEGLTVTSFYGDISEYGTIKTVYPDPNHAGYVYVGTDSSTILHLALSDKQHAQTMSVAPQSGVRAIKQLANGTLWIAADDGIGYFDDGIYQSLGDLPMNNSVEHIVLDFEQNLWFTSSRQGLMKIVANRFHSLIDLSPRVVNTTYRLNDVYYFGTDDGLVVLDKDLAPINNNISTLLGAIRIRSIRKDSHGNLWFGTGQLGVVRYDQATDSYTIFDESKNLAHKHARTIHEMSDGRIAVTTKAGVNVIQNDQVTALYNRDSGINNLEILCLEEGPNGEIYAGSDGDGIYVIAQDGRVTRLGRENGLLSEVILRMKRDPETPGLYWIVTGNSIAYMQNGAITSVTQFPYANNFELFFDRHGRVWILSSNGIYVVQKSALLQNQKIDYEFYDISCGLHGAATANSFSYLDESGNLLISSSVISVVNINDTEEASKSIKLSAPYVEADGKYIPVVNGKVTLPASCKKVKIGAYAFNYSLSNPHLTYRLEGFDDHATTILSREMTPVTYTNLTGGTYTFTLSVTDTMTGNVVQTLSIEITKEKKLTEKAWFWVIIALIGAASIIAVAVLISKKKTNKLLKKQEQNRVLINEMTSVFASCIDMKDAYTNGHSHRVAKYTAMIAEKLGRPKETVEDYYRIALLHDIGKIGIPDNILNKPGRLTDEEFAVMKSHSSQGYDILKEISIAPELAIGAGYHHERQDGKGYPHGVSKDEIPEVAQIIAVADTFDAMHSTRPYRKQMPLQDIAAEIKRVSGTQLNETYAGVLLQLIDEGVFDNDTPPTNNEQ